MKRQTSFKIGFLLFTLCTFFSSCSYAQNGKTVKNSEVKSIDNTTVNNIDNLIRKQILLTNAAKFTNNRTLEGASGFLIRYNGANFAVTARHLLGEEGGVEPEVKINDLNKSLMKWEMMPRVVANANKETIKLNVKGLDFSQSQSDLVLLKVESNNFEIPSLTPNFELPLVGEKLFLIGCPYGETKCKQNSYPAEYVEFDEQENALVCEMDSKVNLSGFSGAPLVNGKGEVLGALVSGGAAGGKNYVLATHIKEIQKIKF